MPLGMVGDWHFYLAAIPAVILLGLSKGGFAGIGMVSTPLMALSMPPLRAAAIMLPILVLSDMVSVAAFRRDFDRRNLAIMLPGAAAGIIAGWFFATRVEDAMISLFVGIMAVIFVGYTFVKGPVERAFARPPAVLPGLFWGGCAGFTSFIANAGAPPFQIYVMPQNLSPVRFAGTATMFFALVNAGKLGPFFALGQFGTDNLAISAALAPIAIVTTLIGVRIVRRIDAEAFRRIIYGLTAVVGLRLVYSGMSGLGLL